MSRADIVRLEAVATALEQLGLLGPDATFEDFERAIARTEEQAAEAEEHLQ